MTSLQQSKIILENKIALNKGIIARKKKEFDQHTSDANELQLIIEKLVVQNWQDEAALKAVNEEISKIPTLAYQKVITTIIAVFICLSAFCQDTIPARKVKIADRVGISMKDGHVMYARPTWRKVKSGFIVKLSNGNWQIDGKEYKPGNHKRLKIKR